MTFEDTMENIVLAFEAVGVAIIVLGGLVALFVGVKDFRSLDSFFGDVRGPSGGR